METIEIALGGKTKSKSAKITDRIKTFDDACRELGIDTSNTLSISSDAQELKKDLKSIAAYGKLIIIARSLNEGWTPDWSNHSQYKYWPWLEYKSGVGFSFFDFDYVFADSNVGSRLCFPTREMAEYFGTQFIDIHQIVLTK